MKFTYAGKVVIRRAIGAAKAAGLDVSSVELSSDGHIRIMKARATPTTPVSLFDRLETVEKL